ncbi:glycosyltransferase [Desulfotalea psychrophila]|uniref:Related to glycosyltransferase involved capsular polysaccharide biosynthesis n=1 Tax=Desulfotalea psychrophila (strain LSv54 / DSM 12343) TaxID=177439 RepID=Q6ASC1_DESPS|nr:glycosyltransferase [Desulfotalea psychrophila]CAG34742.1 related to glycosyltransferase involved capsular polysaccharide biosynthesis [Desulfotalea psychrophila LSv54]
MPKLSFIIPLYNAEKFIEKCLLSILQQNVPIQDYEIIVVNDGTKDDSRKIVSEMQEKFSNIKIIDQENSGPSVTRNRGLRVATGEYVWFIDSDDYIIDNSLQELLDILTMPSPDILYIGYKKVYENKRDEKGTGERNGTAQPYTNHQFLKKFKSFPPMVWLYIYRRTMLTENRLSFPEGIMHEDEEFTPKALFFAKKIIHFNRAIYCYLKREASITSSPWNPLIDINSKYEICHSLAEFSKAHSDSRDIWQSYFSRKTNRLAINVLDLCIAHNKPKLFKEKLAQLKRNRLYPLQAKASLGIKDYLYARYKMIQFNRYLKRN